MKSLARSILWRFSGGVAARLAATKPQRRVPGWWSGLADKHPPEPNRTLRLGFWQKLAGTPVTIGWYDGLKLELVLGNDLSRCLYVDGEVDPNEFAYLGEALMPGMTVIDAGANEGIYSIYSRARVGCEGRVIAIEPSARERLRIERNKALNGMDDITVLPVALAERPGNLMLHVAEDGHAGHNTLSHFAAGWVKAKSEQVISATTLDAIVDEQELAQVDLIKIDIEGAELRALRGAERTMRRDHPALLMEVMEETLATQGASATQLLDYVKQHGYDIFEFSPNDGQPVVLRTAPEQLVGVLALHPKGSIKSTNSR